MKTRKMLPKDLNSIEINANILARILESELSQTDWWIDMAQSLPRISERNYELLEQQYVAVIQKMYPGWIVTIKECRRTEIDIELTPPPTEYIQIAVDIEK